MAEFELEYNLTPEDWRKYRQSYMSRFQEDQGSVFASPYMMYGGLFAIGFGVAFIFGLLQKGGVVAGSSPVGALMGFGVGVAAVMIWAGAWSHRIEGWSLDADGHMLGRRQIRANDDGVNMTGAHYETNFRWSAFVGMSENGDIAMLWLDRGAALIVPARAFGDMLVKRAFFEHVRRNIGRKPEPEGERAFA
jgi:hypothetical protein